METDDNFLSRWSRRKRAIAAGEAVDEPATSLATPSAAHQKDPVSDKKARQAREAELEANRLAAEAINIDALHYESDFTTFFKDGVPLILRQKALRVLWRSNPILANLDGLNDYDENFRDPARNMKVFESAYKIGKGYLFDDTPPPSVSVEEQVAADAAMQLSEENTERESRLIADRRRQEEEKQRAQRAIDEKMRHDQALELAAAENAPLAAPIEEAPVQRPRISLRKRLQFES